MIWIPIIALAALVFVVSAFALKLPKSGWTLFGSALLFGLTGYALQGSPGQSASPKAPSEERAQTGELLIEARREFFNPDRQPSRFVVTSDAFARRGEFEDAAKFLQNALEDNPNDGEAWVALGNALVEHTGGQLTAPAMFAYARAEEVLPGNPAPGYFVGLGFLRMGQPGRARATWAQLLGTVPEDAPWRETLEIRLARLDALLAQGQMGPPAPAPQPATQAPAP
ncbi:tetratricopeptide repeat protein [Erythrobacter sp. W53]|uniref:tetratricopeptide repeat protein n=1 Tax=Erythrobacter sp. W53 TaxID=3425947 RepID=UPI003D7693DB